jgi:hypothetical protein
MNPPPVTQQPPAVGGLQSSVVSLGTHAPQADGCVPGWQLGGWWHFTSGGLGSHVQGGPPLPPSSPPPPLDVVPPLEPEPLPDPELLPAPELLPVPPSFM